MVCGIATGLVEWSVGKFGRTGAVTNDVLVGLVAGLITGVVYNHADWFFTAGHCIETAIVSDSIGTNRDACASVTALDDGTACAAIMGVDGVSEGVCTYVDDRVCMSSILMGTLYWYFYGMRAFTHRISLPSLLS